MMFRTNLWFECGPQEMQTWALNLARHGGFDPHQRSLEPLRRLAELDRAQYVLDSIAAASEEGLIDRDAFLPACFATHEEWRQFIRQLRDFDAYWVNERHFYAMFQLIGEEAACTTYPRIARSLDRIWSAAGGGEVLDWPSRAAAPDGVPAQGAAGAPGAA
jgi:hypothetical protein